MISLDEALAQYRQIPALRGHSSLALDAAHGQRLARPLRSRVDLPPMRQSAMDGYALYRSDVAHASAQNPVSLPISQAVAAGSEARPLLRGQCARIFTGAPLPPGADAVEIQENVDADSRQATFTAPLHEQQNIRQQGEEIACGQAVLAGGQWLDAQSLSIAANAGHAYLSCQPRIRVGVIVTGNELVPPGQPRSGAQIYESNGMFLRHFVQEQGAQLSHFSHARDERTALAEQIALALGRSDLVLISGGASVGEHDFSRAAATDCGVKEVFWKVAQKPGKPLSFGLHQATKPILILPGNPASVYVAAMVHVRAVMAQLRNTRQPICVQAYTDSRLPADARRERLLRASLQIQGGRLQLKELPKQASHMSSNLAHTQAIVRVPAGHDLPAGSLAQIWPCGSHWATAHH